MEASSALFNGLRLAIVLAALVSFPALWPRMQVERPGPVALVMDGNAATDDARAAGRTLVQEMQRYKAQGVNGVAVYEYSLRDLVDVGRATYQSAPILRLLYPNAPLKPGYYYLTGSPTLLAQVRRLWNVPLDSVVIGTQEWLGAPLDVGNMPVGFDEPLLKALEAEGLYIVARPINHPNRRFDTPIVPLEADMVIFGGTEVLGFKDGVDAVLQQLKQKQMAIAQVEGAPQRGFAQMAKELPVLRVFSMRGEWLLQQTPPEATGRFVLAARERGHQILYLRPFESVADNELFLQLLNKELRSSNIQVGLPKPRQFEPSPLRWAAWVGILAGLGLLALGLPSPLGLPVVGLLVLLCLGVARSDVGPLLAAIVFPVLGFLENRPGMQKWLAAVIYALLGVVFLAALGSRPETVLTLEPFRGVSLTLIVPPLLVALSFLPRQFKPVINNLYTYPLKLGDVALGALGLGIIALALLRRGNDASPAIVPDWEITLRQTLQDVMVRPRFKEVFGHAMAPLAFLLPWPLWIRIALTVLVAVGISSIMNTFSHYHTPLSISLFRVLNGILIGLIVGFAGVWLIRKAQGWWGKLR